MITTTVKQAIAAGYLVVCDEDDDFTSYDERKGVRIEHKGDSIVGINTYGDGGCCIDIPVGLEHLDERMFKTLNVKIDIYS